jgi:hypothetical protein
MLVGRQLLVLVRIEDPTELSGPFRHLPRVGDGGLCGLGLLVDESPIRFRGSSHLNVKNKIQLLVLLKIAYVSCLHSLLISSCCSEQV